MDDKKPLTDSQGNLFVIGQSLVLGGIIVGAFYLSNMSDKKDKVIEEDLDGDGKMEQILQVDGKKYVLHKEANGNVVGTPYRLEIVPTTGTYSSSTGNTIDDKVQK